MTLTCPGCDEQVEMGDPFSVSMRNDDHPVGYAILRASMNHRALGPCKRKEAVAP